MKYFFWILLVVAIIVISYLIYNGKKQKDLDKTKSTNDTTLVSSKYQDCIKNYIPGIISAEQQCAKFKS